MPGQQLLLPFGVSLFVHLALLLLFLDALPSAPIRMPSASPGMVVELVAPSTYHDSDGVEQPKVPVSEATVVKSIVDSEAVPVREMRQLLPSVGVYEVGELDGGVALISGPPIEPEYGFADDVPGAVDISVLVTPDGKAVMVWHAPSDLDPAAIVYMANALRVAKFSQPQKSGFPVYGIYRVRVEVGALVNGRER